LCLLASGCREKDLAVDTGDVDTGEPVETGTESGNETGTPGETAREGSIFCAAGGAVSGTNVHGVTCTAPLDIAAVFLTSGNYTWQPGPITFVAP
jgi:hypothetical protein